MSSVHIDEHVLLGYLHGELKGAEAAGVRLHLDECEECRSFVASSRTALRFFDSAHRELLPPPPRPWADLRPRLLELHRTKPLNNVLHAERSHARRERTVQPVWWAAAAAGIAVAVIAMRLSTGQTVSAAELIEKASAQDQPAARLQVTTRKGRFVRTARDARNAELAAMFQNANYDWDEPMRARAFAEWRSSLPEKRDEVRILQNPQSRIGRYYRITTSTPEGALSDVSITIRASDLRAIEERFQFRDGEWVEIAEAPAVDGENSGSPSSIAGDKPQTPSSEPAAVSVSDEVRVLQALHGIGADLGEPVEVRKGERAIEVIVLGAASRREKEIREALAGVPRVDLRFEQPHAVRGPGGESVRSSEEQPAGPLHSRLLRLTGSAAAVESFTNAVLEASEGALARAHAIRQLGERFGAREVLETEDRAAIRKMESEHLRAMKQALAQLTEVLEPLIGPGEKAARTDASVDSRALLGAAQRLDTLLTMALASPDAREDADRVVVRIRQALEEMDRGAAGYRP